MSEHRLDIRQDRVAQTKRHTLRLIDIEQRYLQQQKTGKTGSRLHKKTVKCWQILPNSKTRRIRICFSLKFQ